MHCLREVDWFIGTLMKKSEANNANESESAVLEIGHVALVKEITS